MLRLYLFLEKMGLESNICNCMILNELSLKMIIVFLNLKKHNIIDFALFEIEYICRFIKLVLQ